MSPLLVRKTGDEFELLAGYRRFECLKQLDCAEAFCRVIDTNHEELRSEIVALHYQYESSPVLQYSSTGVQPSTQHSRNSKLTRVELPMTQAITLHRLNEDKFFDVTRPLHGTMFPGLPEFDITQSLSPADRGKVSKLRELRQHLSKIFLVARDGETTAGWSWGYQSMDEEFYMCNSAVMPEYRRKGIYKSLLDKMIEEAANEGFQVITSRHYVGNNGIIIPKLQRGFRIMGTELDLRFGLFVKLAYFVNADSAKVYAYRSGSTAYDDQIGSLIKT